MDAPAKPEGVHATTMRSQFFEERKPVDLNCGRYCAEAAISWWTQSHEPSKGKTWPRDIFHFLPEPKPKTVFAPLNWTVDVGWSPGNEGADIFEDVGVPQSVGEWQSLLRLRGPLIVSGKLGRADWGWFGGVGHFILIVGVDADKKTFYYKDPLAGDVLEPYDAAAVIERATRAYAIKDDALLRKLESQ